MCSVPAAISGGLGLFQGLAMRSAAKQRARATFEAEKQGVSLEITKLIDGFYEDIQKMGGSRWDTSSLLKRLQNND